LKDHGQRSKEGSIRRGGERRSGLLTNMEGKGERMRGRFHDQKMRKEKRKHQPAFEKDVNGTAKIRGPLPKKKKTRLQRGKKLKRGLS